MKRRGQRHSISISISISISEAQSRLSALCFSAVRGAVGGGREELSGRRPAVSKDLSILDFILRTEREVLK